MAVSQSQTASYLATSPVTHDNVQQANDFQISMDQKCTIFLTTSPNTISLTNDVTNKNEEAR